MQRFFSNTLTRPVSGAILDENGGYLMKRFIMMIIMAVAFAGPSFALVDGELYGGYNFGKYTTAGSSLDLKGTDYGARAHMTLGAIAFKIGVGLYYQKSTLKFDVAGTEYDIKKNNFGTDAFLRLTLTSVVQPYGRVGLSTYETIDNGSGTDVEKKYFNSYYVGGGLAFVAPLPIVDLMVFGEYLYGNRFKGDKIQTHTINGGVSVGI
jgi:Outer membrane protein beta-barrel domain